MAEGNIAFLGTSEDAVKHFDNLGRPCPVLHNPSDHFIKELTIKKETEMEDIGKIEVCFENCGRKEVTN